MKVEARVYVHEQQGNRLRVSDRHTKLLGDNSREVTGYSDYKVWLSGDVKGRAFPKGSLIEIKGSQKIEKREHQGRHFTDVVINAYEAELFVRPERAAEEPPPLTDADAPPARAEWTGEQPY